MRMLHSIEGALPASKRDPHPIDQNMSEQAGLSWAGSVQFDLSINDPACRVFIAPLSKTSGAHQTGCAPALPRSTPYAPNVRAVASGWVMVSTTRRSVRQSSGETATRT
jgi:hypothetical protein